MRGVILRFFSVVFLFCFASKAYSSHIVGGVLTYKNIGNDTYEISLIIFRDCFGNPGATFDDPAHIGIFDNNDVFIDSIQLALPPFDTLAPSINSTCFTPPASICYQRAQYFGIKVLPPVPGGYQLAYQRCCRNNTIQNITTPGQVGATYYASIPSSTITSQNSNPVFKNLPPLFLCLNYPYTFDHSALDFDGDSMVYSLYTPLDGASPGNPVPIPTNAPPYFPLTFNPPYTLSNVMGGVPLSINPQTGSLTVTPNTQGQFVVGVQVSEYRNGVYLGATKRDVQFNVVACPNFIVAEIEIPIPSLQAIVVCGSNTVQFNNNSFGAVNYKWNFGDPSTLADTSIAFQPSYTYPGPGSYPSYLVAFSNNAACNDTSFATVNIYPQMTANFSVQNTSCSMSVNFSDASVFPGHPINNWLWNFGDGTTSTQQNPSHTYTTAGTYTVTLSASSVLGCSATHAQTITVASVPTVTVSSSTTICQFDSTQLSASGGISYTWAPAASLNNANSANPIASPTSTTTYTLTAKVLNSLNDTCLVSKLVTVNVTLLAKSSFQANPVICGTKNLTFINTSIGGQSYLWNFGDNGSSANTSIAVNPVHVFSDTGIFQISLIAFNQANQSGCKDTSSLTIHIYPPLIAGFDYEVESCSNTVSFHDSTADAFTAPSTWQWSFGDGQTSSLKNPVHTYAFFGNFTATLIASTWAGCSDTISLPVNLTKLAAAVGPNDTSLCDGNPVQIFAFGGVAYNWTPANGLSSDTVSNPIVTIDSTTTYTVAITAIAADGDTCIITKSVTVFVPYSQLPELAASSDEDTLFAGQSTLLHASPFQNDFNYLWSPASSLNSAIIANPTATPPETITYLVVMTDSFECKREANVTIHVIQLSCAESEVFVPNAFTPNNDGDNDIFYVRGNQIKELYFIVYNRWGEKVFESNDPKSGWNGFYKGAIAEPAVYAYYARIICLNNDELIKQGNVTLLR